MDPDPSWANLSTTSTIQTESMFAVPSVVLQTAVTPTENNTVLSVMTWQNAMADAYVVFLHFADFQSSELRRFNTYVTDNSATDGEYNITVAATNASVLPPILNAFEIYYLIAHDTTATFSKDFDAIMAIKLEYEIKKNWMGDPCSPQKFTWEGVKCRKNTSDNTMRIISIYWWKSVLTVSVCLYEGKNGIGDSFNWATRVRVVLEAAQGLEYLHKGCNLPIIHGDVKTNNVLLGQNLKAKLADFGLSKTYLSDTQTHVSTSTAAGTIGYIDPELTESSDVYSFGVVLLEVATGEPPILPSHGHIIQRVRQKVTSGNISLVADARLRGSYDVSSMWKVVDTAIMCTADVAAQRPTMAAVVVQLKESLALEEAREDRGVTTSSLSVDVVSTSGPLAR
ncbi:hypothetical protein ABZP36_033866 [Zizania latifolia]